MLERFGFTGDRLTARLGDLSGGERRRFQLLRLLLTEPNVLLLDEPTNDLDIETLNVLEDFLDGWPGTLVVVSHDRYFLERVVDSVWALLGDGQISMLPRGVDEYLERRAADLRARESALLTGSSADSASVEHPKARPGSAEERAARKTMARSRSSWRGWRPRGRAARRCSRSTRPTTSGWRRWAPSWTSVLAEKGTWSSSGWRPPRSWSSPIPPRTAPAAAAAVRPGPSGRTRAGRQQRALGVQQGGERPVDGGLALGGEPDQHAAPVLGVGVPLDEPAAGQPVHAVGHRPARHQRLAQQPPGGELVRRSRAPQCRQHVELPRLDLVGGEGRPPGQVEVPGQPGDPAEDGDRREVEVRPLARPRLGELVDLVPHAAHSTASVKNLDIKIVWSAPWWG